MATVAFGMVLMDVTHVANAPAASVGDALGEVRDFLLSFGVMTAVVGIGAVAVAWPSARTRYVLVVSLVLIVAGLLAPALISQAVRDAESATSLRIGPWIRIGVGASASALASVGFWMSSRAPGSDQGRRSSA
jgi:hypothetical protein